jgi:hypothetical protein
MPLLHVERSALGCSDPLGDGGSGPVQEGNILDTKTVSVDLLRKIPKELRISSWAQLHTDCLQTSKRLLYIAIEAQIDPTLFSETASLSDVANTAPSTLLRDT